MRGTLALTPALSPEERVNPSPACRRYERVEWSYGFGNKSKVAPTATATGKE